jgi:excisionase family DNA binding protein
MADVCFDTLKTGRAAKLLGISPKTLRRLVTAGLIPAYRVGTRLQFRPDEIERHLAASRVNSRPLPPEN